MNRPESKTAEAPSKDRQEIDHLFSLIYEELRRLASSTKRNEWKAALDSTALVHEAWLKLRDSKSLASKSPLHFKAIAAQAMRQVLVDEARRRNSQKRGAAGLLFVTLGGFHDEIACDAELLDLDEALRELNRLSPRQAQVVEKRFFGGLSVTETSELLGVSESVVERDWRVSRAWLASKMRPATER